MATTESLKNAVVVRGTDQFDGGAVARRKELKSLLGRMRDEYGKALAGSIPAERFVRIATSEIERTPQLAECTQESFFGALMTAAQYGLEPGPLGLYWLTPRRVKGVWTCVGIIGWKGYRELVWRSSQTLLSADAIREGDHFRETRGGHPNLVHEPAPLGAPRGDVLAFYAVAHVPGAAITPHVVLRRAEVDDIRDRHAMAKDNGPWVTHYDAMGRKTAVRRLMSLVPQTGALAGAAALDERPRLYVPGGRLDEVGELDPAGGAEGEADDRGPEGGGVVDIPGDPGSAAGAFSREQQ
jgi:recombination protein RecT